MIEEENLIFPNLIFLNDYLDFQLYFRAVYNIFENNFIKSKPQYNGLDVGVKKYPEVDGIHRTFYHITHEGEDEQNRLPDIKRMERIHFPRFYIDNTQHKDILIWENTRGRDTRVLMFNEEQSYVVILNKREGYYLFWAAYLVEQEHRKNKLLKEYKAYLNTKTA